MTQILQISAPHVGATQEIWDAINVDLQQIVDDVSCWEGRHAERMCERLESVIKRLNAAVGHEREGYEAAIASSFEVDKYRTLRADVLAYNTELDKNEAAPTGDDYNELLNIIQS